jgi:uridine nucleosidase
MIEMIKAHPQEITLLLIGPLTNAAMALLLEPGIVDLVESVVIMGGAVRCPGNITPAAEANFFHDPHAAQIVMRAGWPIILAPLDICEDGMVPQALLDEICKADKALTPYIAGGLPFFQDFLKNFDIYDKVDFPDAMAAAFLLAPEIFEVEEVPLFVETEGSCMGQSLSVPAGKWYQDLQDKRMFPADRSIAPSKVMFGADYDKFLALVASLLT